MADNKRYYWLKLPDDFFRQKEIKGLRKIAGGDTYTIIYLKMLLRSLKNSGVLYYDGIEADFISELAMDIDEEKENVAITVQFLLAKGLLEELNGDEYFLASCTKMIGSETAGAMRVRKHRETYKNDTEGVIVFKAIATDMDGNTAETVKTIKYDKTKPNGSDVSYSLDGNKFSITINVSDKNVQSPEEDDEQE